MMERRQEQTLGTLDTKIDAMMERRIQAFMDRWGIELGRTQQGAVGNQKMGNRTREDPAGSRG